MNTSLLKPADLIFIRGNRWLDFPIKLITQSQYTHVAGYVGYGKLIEAQGLRTTGYEELRTYEGVADVYRYSKLTEFQTQQIINFVQNEIGQQYDYMLVGWEALRYLFGVMLPYIKSKRRICSTLWADAFKSAGVNLCPNQRYPTPGDLIKSRFMRKVGTI